MFTSSHFSRRIALLAAPTLALSALAVTSAPSYAATDPAPAFSGASWLADELDGARFAGPFSFGLTIDSVLALDEVGGFDDDVDAVTASLAADVDDYLDYSYEDEEGTPHSGTSGGSVAKTLVLATEVGADATNFGGRNLVGELESYTSTKAGIEGRVVGQLDGAVDDSYTNTIIQALAVQGLRAVSDPALSPALDRATDYLLAQQCAGGFFREGPPAPGDGSQSCIDAGTDPSIDSTGAAVLALTPLAADSQDIEAVVDRAVDWLKSAQSRDGSWGDNANSTGLAARAMSAAGDVESAESAAGWVRGHQAEDAAPCVTGLADEVGAIALDDSALLKARSEGITEELRDQFRRATAQALPALLVAPSGSAADRSRSSFARAGASTKIKVDDLAPGQAICFGGRSIQTLTNARTDGSARLSVKLPKRQATRSYDLSLSDAPIGTITFTSLRATTFQLRLKKANVAARGTQKLIVKGLAVGERVRVKVNGSLVERGTSGGNSRFTTKFGVGKRVGEQKVRVIGEFGNRNAVEKFRVVKAR